MCLAHGLDGSGLDSNSNAITTAVSRLRCTSFWSCSNATAQVVIRAEMLPESQGLRTRDVWRGIGHWKDVWLEIHALPQSPPGQVNQPIPIWAACIAAVVVLDRVSRSRDYVFSMPKLGATGAKTVQVEFANLLDLRGFLRFLWVRVSARIALITRPFPTGKRAVSNPDPNSHDRLSEIVGIRKRKTKSVKNLGARPLTTLAATRNRCSSRKNDLSVQSISVRA
jgi:hypothetical protein